jgi:hypothetical protein
MDEERMERGTRDILSGVRDLDTKEDGARYARHPLRREASWTRSGSNAA